MSLRRKVLIILLLVAVLPMLAVRGVQAVSIYKLQERVAEDMRDQLTREAEQDLLRTVDAYADSLVQQASLMFALLQVQASEVERRLAMPEPGNPPRVPTVSQFAGLAEDRPEVLAVQLSERHARVDDAGRLEPLAVSYATHVVLTLQASNADGPSVAADMARLADMTGVYRRVYEQGHDLILWQYTTLESGVHYSYPGKADFPAEYAPRQRGWYRHAVAADRPVVARPYVDATTRQLVLTFSQPVRGVDGKPAGVTAIDLPLSRMLDPELLKTDWASEARVAVIAGYPSLANDPDAGRFDTGPDTSFPPDVYVLADVNRERQGQRRADITTLPIDDEAQRQALVDDLLAPRSGVHRVSVDGQDQMLAYGRIDGGAASDRPVFVLITAPTDAIHLPAETAIANVQDDLRESLVTTGAMLLGLIVLVGVAAWLMSFRLTRPIVELAGAAHRVAGGDLDTRVAVGRRDELGQLGQAFNDMVPALHDRMRIRESLQVAMQVQQSLLPAAPPSVPGLDIAGHSEYCDETGGDYYDFIQLEKLGPDAVAIAVGDVTGHGIAAALLMATGRALIRSNAEHPGTLGEVFTAVNHQLCAGQFTGRFMTLMYLVVHAPSPGTAAPVSARFLAAGHDPVIVYRPSDDAFTELAGHDIPLGIDADWTYREEQSDALRPGDVLVIGTDGIWECFNPGGEQFGKDRLREAVRAHAKESAEAIAKAVSEACRCWRGEREQADDITLVVVKISG